MAGAGRRARQWISAVGWERRSHIWRRRDGKAVGVDLSRAVVARAKSAHSGVSFVQANVLALPFGDRVFHLALDRGCFHYLSPSQWAGYAAETWRILRPGGRLLLRACLTSGGT